MRGVAWKKMARKMKFGIAKYKPIKNKPIEIIALATARNIVTPGL